MLCWNQEMKWNLWKAVLAQFRPPSRGLNWAKFLRTNYKKICTWMLEDIKEISYARCSHRHGHSMPLRTTPEKSPRVGSAISSKISWILSSLGGPLGPILDPKLGPKIGPRGLLGQSKIHLKKYVEKAWILAPLSGICVFWGLQLGLRNGSWRVCICSSSLDEF